MSCTFQQETEINVSHLEFPSNQSYLFKCHILQQLKQVKTDLSLRREQGGNLKAMCLFRKQKVTSRFNSEYTTFHFFTLTSHQNTTCYIF